MNLVFISHAHKRMNDRGITQPEVEKVIVKGTKWFVEKEGLRGRWHARMCGIEVVFEKSEEFILVVTVFGVSEMFKCPMCDGKVKKAMIKEEYLGHFIGNFEGFKCAKCGETFLTADSVDKAQEKIRELGLFGLSERTAVAKSGNSLVVRIKKNIANYLGLIAGKEVTVHPEGKNRLVVDLA